MLHFVRGLRAGGLRYLIVVSADALGGLSGTALAEALAPHCPLPVRVTRDGEALQPDAVHVTASAGYVRLQGDTVRLLEGRAPGEREIIDELFATPSPADMPWTAFVLLACASASDGVAGLRAVREAGGAAFVARTPAEGPTARFGGPGAGLVQWLAPEHMGAALHAWQLRAARHREVDALQVKQLIDRLAKRRVRCRPEVIQRQVAVRTYQRGLARESEYVALAERCEQELHALRESILIGSTSFFRDADVFEALRARVSAALAERPHEPFRAWVAGCSTGEEAYSLAMMLRELLPEHGPGFRIFATDVRERAIAHARRGVYRGAALADLSPERRTRFFVPVADGTFVVSRALRHGVLFARHDVLTDAPYPRLDLVSCRNVLLYYDRDAQRRVLEHVHFGLRLGAMLLLGTAESPIAADTLFVPLDYTHRLYVKQPTRVCSGGASGGVEHLGGRPT